MKFPLPNRKRAQTGRLAILQGVPAFLLPCVCDPPPSPPFAPPLGVGCVFVQECVRGTGHPAPFHMLRAITSTKTLSAMLRDALHAAGMRSAGDGPGWTPSGLSSAKTGLCVM